MTYILMMVPRMMMIAASAVLVLTGSTGGTLHAATETRVLWQGPALAGASVVWEEETGGKGSLRLWAQSRGERVLYSSNSLVLGRPFAASRSLLAFERTYPTCAPQPGHVCPEGTDAVIGPLTGPYRILARPRTCFLPTVGRALALDGGVAAYLELDCSRQRLRILVRDVLHSGRPRVVREAPFSDGCCRDLALAGRYVAWREGRHVVVYNRLTRRLAYRAQIGPAGANVDFEFDLQRDGKLAVAFRLIEFGRAGAPKIAWFSPSGPLLHVLPFRGSSIQVSFGGDRVAFEASTGQNTSTLVVTDLHGRARTVARLPQPTRLRGFDLDGRRIVWASDRITARRVDCPPPGQGRPCIRRESGVTSVWLRPFGAHANTLVARLKFDDVVGPR